MFRSVWISSELTHANMCSICMREGALPNACIHGTLESPHPSAIGPKMRGDSRWIIYTPQKASHCSTHWLSIGILLSRHCGVQSHNIFAHFWPFIFNCPDAVAWFGISLVSFASHVSLLRQGATMVVLLLIYGLYANVFVFFSFSSISSNCWWWRRCFAFPLIPCFISGLTLDRARRHSDVVDWMSSVYSSDYS